MMIKAYLNQDIIVVRFGGQDQFRRLSPTTDIARKAYVDWTTRRVRDIHGNEVEAAGTVYMELDPDLTHKDMIKINSIKYAIIDYKPRSDFSPSHMEISIK